MRLMEGYLKTVARQFIIVSLWNASIPGMLARMEVIIIKVTRVSTLEPEINPLTLQGDAGEFSNMIYCRRGRCVC